MAFWHGSPASQLATRSGSETAGEGAVSRSADLATQRAHLAKQPTERGVDALDDRQQDRHIGALAGAR